MIIKGKEKKRIAAVSKSILILFFTVCICSLVRGNGFSDTSKKQLLASVEKKENAGSIILDANVIFPEVLTGNEEETLEYIEKFSERRRDYIIRTYTRGKKYFPKITAILKKYDLPEELRMLIALESAFNPNAVSKAGAVGYWQFMDDVAKEYGLKYVPRHTVSKKISKSAKGKQSKKPAEKKHQAGRDDRKNFNKSTYAAARYLKDRSRNLNNDLLLMVASYNCGVGNVWEAMKRTGKDNPEYWDVKDYLPAETRAYVMNFITLNVLFHNYDKFISNTLCFTPVKVKLDNFDQHMTEALDEATNQK